MTKGRRAANLSARERKAVCQRAPLRPQPRLAFAKFFPFPMLLALASSSERG